ncbi:mCG1033208 [Mus musculus]|nr:mCG1033208 [Mus musculus]
MTEEDPLKNLKISRESNRTGEREKSGTSALQEEEEQMQG